jgi:hypothetical protein
MRLVRATLIWMVVLAAILVPLALAGTSELLAYRGPVYIVAGSVVHSLLIEGTMEWVSKAVLCALVAGAAAKVIADRLWRRRASPRGADAAVPR